MENSRVCRIYKDLLMQKCWGGGVQKIGEAQTT